MSTQLIQGTHYSYLLKRKTEACVHGVWKGCSLATATGNNYHTGRNNYQAIKILAQSKQVIAAP